MTSIGNLPNNISFLDALNSIGENIIIADNDYNVSWMNSSAEKLLSIVAPLFGLAGAEEVIGINMSHFHKKPQHQQKIMDELTKTYRARINIKDRFITDIVITPIKSSLHQIEGYIVMLMDVTTKAEEEERKEKLIHALSVPILRMWEKTIALPLIGEFDTERGNKMVSTVLQECASNGIQYVLLDLSGVSDFGKSTSEHIYKLVDCLKLLGATCIIVGITTKLAMSIGELKKEIPVFNTSYAGLKYILEQQKITRA